MLKELQREEASSIENELHPDESVSMKIPVIEGQTLLSNTRTIVSSMELKYIIHRHVIPYKKPLLNEGYQRVPAEARIRRFAKELNDQAADVPTSILMNIRYEDYNKYLSSDENGNLFLEIPLEDDLKFYIVDGQHRILAYKKLYDEDNATWGNKKLQFVCMLGADENEEMDQFYKVNSTAKSVRTDLAYALLKQLADHDSGLKQQIETSGMTWKLKGQTVAEKLYESSFVWSGKIRLANAEKSKTVLPVASLVNSLKNLNKYGFFGKLSADKQCSIINAYWEGIKIVCPEPFGENYGIYSLQKGLGVSVMHELLVTVIEHVKESGGLSATIDSRAYAEIMKPVMEGLTDVNLDGEKVSGGDFWKTAKYGGAAGAYSSSAGKRLLLAKLEANLPELKIGEF